MQKKVALIILDGMGVSPEKKGNAVRLASMPFYHSLYQQYPHSELQASGEFVGLPQGQMGNSEVGHFHLGSGFIVHQSLTKINSLIEDGSFFFNPRLVTAIEHVKNNSSNLHLMGLLSDGGVHSHLNHLKALLKLAKKYQVKNVYIHAFLDGRDTPITSGLHYLKSIQKECNSLKIGKIASITGRYFAMDRNNNWDRTEKAYNAISEGIGEHTEDYEKTILDFYKNDITDEFIPPVIITEKNQSVNHLKENDSVIFFNFRPDRARQLSQAIGFNNFSHFARKTYKSILLTTFMEYNREFQFPFAFAQNKVPKPLGEFLEQNHLKQLRAAETEKYPHVTFFFNAMREKPYQLEKRILIPSPDVSTYDLKPEMSAYTLTDTIVNELLSEHFDFVLINYANPDMVGHTGNIEAGILALEAIDSCLKQLFICLEKNNFDIILTSDHGNIEEMITKDNKVLTTHTTNPVNCIYVPSNKENLTKVKLNSGSLIDIPVTILSLFNISCITSMQGKNLIQHTGSL